MSLFIEFYIFSAGVGREGRLGERNSPGHCSTHYCSQVILMVIMVMMNGGDRVSSIDDGNDGGDGDCGVFGDRCDSGDGGDSDEGHGKIIDIKKMTYR